MSPLRLTGSTSGYSEIDAPAVAGDQTFTLPGTGGTLTTTNGGQTIEFGAGSASTPSITTTGDSNTGIYFPAADQLAISTNGNGRLFIASDGKVGLGTSAPQALLHLNANTPGGVGGKIRLTNYQARTAGNATSIEFANNSDYYSGVLSGAYIQSINPTGTVTNEAVLTFGTGSGGTVLERVRIDEQGRVGVGSTGPNEKLTVADASSANVYIALQNSTTGTTSADGWYVGAAGTEFQIYGKENGPITFSLNSSERARLDSSGRLLVGTASTSAGSTLVLSGRSDSATGGSRLYLSCGTTSPTNNAQLGGIYFSDDNENIGTRIESARDGGTWTSGSSHPSRLTFSTTADGASSPTERMRIQQNGFIQIGTGGSAPGSSVPGIQIGTPGFNFWSSYSSGTGAYGHMVFGNSNGQVGGIVTSASATAYNTSSDYRLKENVVDLDGAIDRLKQLAVHRFNFIADPGTVVDGFIAHEVQDIVPEAITGTKDEVDDEDNPVYQGIDQSKLVPLLTAALQEAVAKIESLEARLTAAGI